jgi:hypothetical protein
MARIRITNTVSATHDSTQIEGLREADFDIRVNEKAFASDGESEEYDPIGLQADGTVTFDSAEAANQALGGAVSNLVVTTRKKGGGTRIFTCRNAQFTSAGTQLPTTQGQQGGQFRCRVRLNPGASDTPADMITNIDGA